MADYLTARARIASRIASVSVASPVAASIKKVYETPPDGAAVNMFPCVIITGYTMRYLRGPGKRERTYNIGLRLAVHPSDGATMYSLLDAFKEAISVVFDGATTLGLGGAYHVMEGPNWIRPEPQADGGGTVWDDGEIVVVIKDAANFNA